MHSFNAFEFFVAALMLTGTGFGAMNNDEAIARESSVLD
jgi:hypothetical protein